MSLFSRISPRIWIIFPVCALGFFVWINHRRIQRVEDVTALAAGSEWVKADAKSATGYAHDERKLIVPERNENSFHWIAQTQQMFAQREARVRHVDYDNAPQGREANSSSPYRWWLGFIAWIDHTISGRPLGLSVERAALWADPILHGLLLVGCTFLVASQFGGFAAALISVGLVALFPFAAGFLPGAPDAHGLASICAFGSILFVLIAIRSRWTRAPVRNDARADQKTRLWFALAGVVGGFGVWINVSTQIPIIFGIFVGGLLGTWVARRALAENSATTAASFPWRIWSWSGGTTILVAYLAEYFPAHLGSWRLESIHPLYGLAWMGAGELLEQAATWVPWKKNLRRPRTIVAILLAVLAMASIPVIMWKTGDQAFLARDLLWARLSNLPNSIVAPSLGAWWSREGTDLGFWALMLPLIALVPAGWILLNQTAKIEIRIMLAVAIAPVLIAFAFACEQLSWWGVLDGALLALVVAGTEHHGTAGGRPSRWVWAVTVTLFAVPGAVQLWPQKSAGVKTAPTPLEAQELIERHLAHWLATRTEEGAVVYTAPHQTTTLCFYGGLRGIGSFAVENRVGFGASLAIAGAVTMEEVQGQLQARGVKYIVVPLWDHFFEDFARLYLSKNFSNRTSFLVHELRHWNLPPWLRPVPYQAPVSGGIEGQSVLVFEVVDEQSPAAATSRLAEYLVEVGEVAQAVSFDEALRHFPGDIGALTARIQIQNARGDTAAAIQTLGSMLVRLSSGADRFLPWDRRVSLAIILAQADRLDLAREQVRRCLTEVDEEKVRSLTTGSLYQLEVVSKAFGLGISDPRLSQLALDLLPADLRSQL